ncbi:hypothetical protein GCM10018779_32910 [Streptomyces griseocarneus]|nr:hypothetical protein GCM10018779_32910 [Streptomyces griseocarneus]
MHRQTMCCAPRIRSVPYGQVARPSPDQVSSSVTAAWLSATPSPTSGQEVFCSSQAFGVKEELTKTTQPPL